jgi:hypothetical protein
MGWLTWQVALIGFGGVVMICLTIMKLKGGKLKTKDFEGTLGNPDGCLANPAIEKPIEKVEEKKEIIVEHECYQKKEISFIIEILFDLSKAIKALLEAQKGNINGNVDEAIIIMDGINDKANSFMLEKIGGVP